MKAFIHAVAARPTKEGGATRLMAALAKGLVEVAPHDSYTFCIHRDLDLALPPQINTIRVAPRGSLNRFWFDNYTWPRLVKNEHADVVVALLGFGAFRPGAKKISVLPDFTYFCPNRRVGRRWRTLFRIWIRSIALKASLQRASLVVVPSETFARAASPVLGSNRIEVVRFPWDGEWRDPQQAGIEQVSAPLRLLYVSQLQPHKAHWTLPAIVAATKERGIDVHLTVAINRRDNPYLWDRFHDEVRAFELGDDITVLSDQTDLDIARLYRQADVFLFPSLCESFGYPMVEATAAALPVVAVRTDINREMLGEGALYYEQGDVGSAAESIVQLARDAALRRDLVQTAQKHLREIVPNSSEYASCLHKLMAQVAGE